MTMLREVHGRPQLDLPPAQDAGPTWGHHHWHFFLEGLRVRGRELRARFSNPRFRGARNHREGHR